MSFRSFISDDDSYLDGGASFEIDNFRDSLALSAYSRSKHVSGFNHSTTLHSKLQPTQRSVNASNVMTMDDLLSEPEIKENTDESSMDAAAWKLLVATSQKDQTKFKFEIDFLKGEVRRLETTNATLQEALEREKTYKLDSRKFSAVMILRGCLRRIALQVLARRLHCWRVSCFHQVISTSGLKIKLFALRKVLKMVEFSLRTASFKLFQRWRQVSHRDKAKWNAIEKTITMRHCRRIFNAWKIIAKRRRSLRRLILAKCRRMLRGAWHVWGRCTLQITIMKQRHALMIGWTRSLLSSARLRTWRLKHAYARWMSVANQVLACGLRARRAAQLISPHRIFTKRAFHKWRRICAFQQRYVPLLRALSGFRRRMLRSGLACWNRHCRARELANGAIQSMFRKLTTHILRVCFMRLRSLVHQGAILAFKKQLGCIALANGYSKTLSSFRMLRASYNHWRTIALLIGRQKTTEKSLHDSFARYEGLAVQTRDMSSEYSALRLEMRFLQRCRGMEKLSFLLAHHTSLSLHKSWEAWKSMVSWLRVRGHRLLQLNHRMTTQYRRSAMRSALSRWSSSMRAHKHLWKMMMMCRYSWLRRGLGKWQRVARSQARAVNQLKHIGNILVHRMVYGSFKRWAMTTAMLVDAGRKLQRAVRLFSILLLRGAWSRLRRVRLIAMKSTMTILTETTTAWKLKGIFHAWRSMAATTSRRSGMLRRLVRRWGVSMSRAAWVRWTSRVHHQHKLKCALSSVVLISARAKIRQAYSNWRSFMTTTLRQSVDNMGSRCGYFESGNGALQSKNRELSQMVHLLLDRKHRLSEVLNRSVVSWQHRRLSARCWDIWRRSYQKRKLSSQILASRVFHNWHHAVRHNRLVGTLKAIERNACAFKRLWAVQKLVGLLGQMVGRRLSLSFNSWRWTTARCKMLHRYLLTSGFRQWGLYSQSMRTRKRALKRVLQGYRSRSLCQRFAWWKLRTITYFNCCHRMSCVLKVAIYRGAFQKWQSFVQRLRYRMLVTKRMAVLGKLQHRAAVRMGFHRWRTSLRNRDLITQALQLLSLRRSAMQRLQLMRCFQHWRGMRQASHMKSIHVASAYRALKSYHRKKLCGKCFSLWLMQASRSHRLPYRLSSAEAYRPIQHCKIFISRLHALLAQKAEMQDVVEFIDGCLLDLLANESVDCHVMILDTDSAKDIAICSTKPCTSKIETLRLTKAIVEAMEPESYVWQQQQPASKSLAMLQPAYVTLYPYAASATPYRILYMFVTKGWNGSRANELVARKSLDGAKNVSLLQICNLLRLSGLLIAPISIFLDNAAELLSQRLSKGLYRISESVDQAQQQLTSIKADLEAKELELEELRRSMKLKDELIKRLEGSRLKHKSHHQQLRNSLGNAEALLASRKSELERSKDTNKRLRERLKALEESYRGLEDLSAILSSAHQADVK